MSGCACEPAPSIVEFFLGQRASVRIGVELHDLAVLGALALPMAVIGLEPGEVGTAGGGELLRCLFLADPVGAGLIGEGYAGACDQRGGGDERFLKSGHGFPSASDDRATTIGGLNIRFFHS